jgi:hypothetical protein
MNQLEKLTVLEPLKNYSKMSHPRRISTAR